MASLNAALNMGAKSLFTQQSAIQTAGHNIANMGTEGFSRQEVVVETELPQPSGTGGGVKRGPVKRVMDRFTNQKIITEKSQQGVYESREEFLTKIEIVFNELDNSGLRNAMNEFWNSWSLLANQPESDVARVQVTKKGESLAAKFRTMHTELRTLRGEANGKIKSTVSEANNYAQQIADLNKQINTFERGGRRANDARDQRERLMTELSELIDYNWFENKEAQIVIQVGSGWPLVEGESTSLLKASNAGGEVGMYHIEGVGKNEKRQDLTDDFRSGKLAELLKVRDKSIIGYMDKLDDVAFDLSREINKIHSTGTGLNSAVRYAKSSFGLNKDAQKAPLPYLKDGVFQIHLVDRNNNVSESYEVEVRAGIDTLDDVVNRINQTVGDAWTMQAQVDEEGSVALRSLGDRKFIFGEDSTEFLQIMGMNNFFETLQGARDIKIATKLIDDPNLISTGKDLVPGDNQVALAIAKLQSTATMKDGTLTFDEFYNGVIAEVGLNIQRNQTDKEHQDNLVEQFQQIKDSISSVNLDEEMTNMVQLQKAYQASARFITTVDEMTQTLIQM